jgi:hypothetical protein
MNGNPLKKAKKKDDEVEKWTKVKPKISTGAAKAIADIKTVPDVEWLERYIEELCRTNCWPLQLVSSDFIARMGGLLDPQTSLNTLERLRADYAAAHPFSKPPMDDYSFLEEKTET